jgi:hypothetical protein
MSEQLTDYYVDRVYGNAYGIGEKYIEELYKVLRCVGEGDDQVAIELDAIDVLRLIQQVKLAQVKIRELRPTIVVYPNE